MILFSQSTRIGLVSGAACRSRSTARLQPQAQTLLPVQTTSASARAVAAPVLVRSWTGARTCVHDKANHGPWLSIALFLADLPRREPAPASAGERSAAEAGAVIGARVSAVPVGNHGENKTSTASTPQEVAR